MKNRGKGVGKFVGQRVTLLSNPKIKITFQMKHKLIVLKIYFWENKRSQRARFGPRAILCPPLPLVYSYETTY